MDGWMDGWMRALGSAQISAHLTCAVDPGKGSDPGFLFFLTFFNIAGGIHDSDVDYPKTIITNRG